MSLFVCWFVKITAYLVQFLCFRTKIYYEDKKVQGRKIRGAAIVVSNHMGLMDFALWMFVFPGRTLRCLMAEILFKRSKLLNWFLRKLGGIRIERNDFNFGFVEEAKEILGQGGVVEIFPESRLPLPGEKRPLPFKPSAAYIAVESGAPVIPVYTSGDYFSIRRTRAVIGKPIDPALFNDPTKSKKENIENLTKHLEKVVEGLKYEIQKENKTR